MRQIKDYSEILEESEISLLQVKKIFDGLYPSHYNHELQFLWVIAPELSALVYYNANSFSAIKIESTYRAAKHATEQELLTAVNQFNADYESVRAFIDVAGDIHYSTEIRCKFGLIVGHVAATFPLFRALVSHDHTLRGLLVV